VLAAFGPDEATLRAGVKSLVERLVALPTLLRDVGVPPETLAFPGLGLDHTAERLRAWGLS
jgi:hypothetical protein